LFFSFGVLVVKFGRKQFITYFNYLFGHIRGEHLSFIVQDFLAIVLGFNFRVTKTTSDNIQAIFGTTLQLGPDV